MAKVQPKDTQAEYSRLMKRVRSGRATWAELSRVRAMMRRAQHELETEASERTDLGEG